MSGGHLRSVRPFAARSGRLQLVGGPGDPGLGAQLLEGVHGCAEVFTCRSRRLGAPQPVAVGRLDAGQVATNTLRAHPLVAWHTIPNFSCGDLVGADDTRPDETMREFSVKLTRARAIALLGATVAVAVVTVGGMAMKRETGGPGSPAAGLTTRTPATPLSPATGRQHPAPAKGHDAAVPAQGIVGGSRSYTTLPYIGAIYDQAGGFRCGATLIADNAILTAFHCFTPEAPVDGASVRLGSTDRLDGGTVAALTGPPVQVVDTDAAIIMLRDPVSIPPAILSDTMLAPGQPVLNVGWGLECSYDEPDPSQVGTGPVPVVPCPELPRYLKELHSTTVECPANARHAGDVCSRSDEPGGRTQHGDSGSPLLVYGSDGVWRVAGVASGSPIGDPWVAIYAETGFSKPQIGRLLGHSLPY